MHPFSVDFLTSVDSKKDVKRSLSPSQLSTSDGIRTPSPNSSFSPQSSPPQGSVSDPDVAKALLALERQAARKPAPGLEKPPLSYIALISMAILSSREKKLLLSDIYQWIMDNFDYYNNDQKAWRNSIRHNLSLNECFIKAGRSENGKGHYWAIHQACMEDFARGDYRRRQARRRAKRNNQEVENAPKPVASYMPSPMRFSPYAMPMYTPYYAMSPMNPTLPAIATMAPLSPHMTYPSFPMSMMTPFTFGQHLF